MQQMGNCQICGSRGVPIHSIHIQATSELCRAFSVCLSKPLCIAQWATANGDTDNMKRVHEQVVKEATYTYPLLGKCRSCPDTVHWMDTYMSVYSHGQRTYEHMNCFIERLSSKMKRVAAHDSRPTETR